MRILIQRVSSCNVAVSGKKTVGEIGAGLLLLVGIEEKDNQEDIDWLVRKVVNMRLFPDASGNMNVSVSDVSGDILVVSQFTLHASTRKGNRPSFVKSAPPEKAEERYNEFVQKLKSSFTGKVETGVFGAMMEVALVNDGPVTIWLDSKNKE